jgi:solute carrier family 26 (sodium-independent sulfate anion transporter), member 11
MIALSAALLLVRMFKARGRFMGTVSVHINAPTDDNNKKNDDMSPSGDASPSGSSSESVTTATSEVLRTVFLPLSRDDGSNPLVKIEQPGSGIFIYRFSQDFNYTNANSYIDHMLSYITLQTKATTASTATTNGDRPWNDPRLSGFGKKASQTSEDDSRPTLKALILDFSAVNHVDITSVQLLVDARNLLDRHAAPHTVQWHFSNIQSRWTKRALGNAGFGYFSQEAEDGQARHWKSVFSVAEVADRALDGSEEIAGKECGKRMTQDIELGQIWHDAPEERISRISPHDQPTVISSEEIHVAGISNWATNRMSFDKGGAVMTERVEEVEKVAVHGVNRPFFHLNLEVALKCARENIVD